MESQKCSPSLACPIGEAYGCVLDAVHQINDLAVANALLNSLCDKWITFSQDSTHSNRNSMLHSLVLAEIELERYGIDVIYPCNKIMPLDLDLVRAELAHILPPILLKTHEELGIDIEELTETGGIINRIFFVSLADSSQSRSVRRYVLKVLPPYAHWKKRKCENEVLAMNLACAQLKSANSNVSDLSSVAGEESAAFALAPHVLTIPSVVRYVSDRAQSQFLREYILMSYHEGSLLETIKEDDPIRVETSAYMKHLENLFHAMKFTCVGSFAWDDYRNEVVVGPEIEDQEFHDSTDLRTWLWRRLRFTIEQGKKWLYRKRRLEVEIALDNDAIQETLEDLREYVNENPEYNAFAMLSLEEMNKSMLESFESLVPTIEKIMELISNGTIPDSEFALGEYHFDHFDLHDGNILVQFHDSPTGESFERPTRRLKSMVILDFEWSRSNVTDYSPCLFARLQNLMWSLYLVHCSMRDYRRTRRKLLCEQKKYLDEAAASAASISKTLNI